MTKAVWTRVADFILMIKGLMTDNCCSQKNCHVLATVSYFLFYSVALIYLPFCIVHCSLLQELF